MLRYILLQGPMDPIKWIKTAGKSVYFSGKGEAFIMAEWAPKCVLILEELWQNDSAPRVMGVRGRDKRRLGNCSQ